MKTTLYVGNHNYSSWSLRAWLVLRWSRIAFEERLIPLRQPGYGTRQIVEVRAVSPGGTVPALHVETPTGEVVRVWDTLAIAEWAAERAPDAGLWPDDPSHRATARAVTAEMHAGFAALRRDLPMNLKRRSAPAPWAADTLRDIARVVEIWSELRAQHSAHGPWLFGQRTIADAFYMPVAARFRSYSVSVPPTVAGYLDTALSDDDLRVWEAAAVPDSWDHAGYPTIDGLYRTPGQRAELDPVSARNRAAYQEFAAAWAARDLDRVMRCLADDVVYAASVGPEPGATYRGAAAARAGIAQMIAYDDALHIVTDVLEVDGDRGLVQWSYTVRGEAGPRVIRGVDLLAFRDGKITRKDAFRKTHG